MLLVEKLGEEASEKIIPSGRSVKVNKYAQPDILKALDIAKVKYRIVTYGTKSLPPYADEVGMSAEFIVFEEGHEVKGFKVVSEFNRSMNPGKYLYKNQASQP